MKFTTYIIEITTQKYEKHLSEGRNPLVCLSARLLASCQLRNFSREFTEKCSVVFGQSNCAIISVVLVTPIFLGILFYYSFYGMALRF